MSPAPSSLGLQFVDIHKRFGNHIALRRVSLAISPGEAAVLAGRNGSGKTTLLRLAAGLIRPTSGKLSLGPGENAAAHNRGRIGFVGHQTMLYDELTAEENLLFFGRLQGIEEPKRRADVLLQESGLADRRSSLVRTFSRGMRQRLAISRALLHRPSILLLDEPATGLDTPGIAWLSATLRRLHAAGCTLLVSLHGHAELAGLASRGIRLEMGAVAADSQAGGSLESVLRVAEP